MCGCSAGKTKMNSSYMFTIRTVNNRQIWVRSYNKPVCFTKFNFSR